VKRAYSQLQSEKRDVEEKLAIMERHAEIVMVRRKSLLSAAVSYTLPRMLSVVFYASSTAMDCTRAYRPCAEHPLTAHRVFSRDLIKQGRTGGTPSTLALYT
jgi:hypothetical protein